MKTFLYVLAALGAFVALFSILTAVNAFNEIFGALVGLGALIALVSGLNLKKKDTVSNLSFPTSYDPYNISRPKKRDRPSAVRYDP